MPHDDAHSSPTPASLAGIDALAGVPGAKEFLEKLRSAEPGEVVPIPRQVLDAIDAPRLKGVVEALRHARTQAMVPSPQGGVRPSESQQLRAEVEMLRASLAALERLVQQGAPHLLTDEFLRTPADTTNATRPEHAAAVREQGRWTVERAKTGEPRADVGGTRGILLSSDDFTHDALLSLSGDFRDEAQALAYAQGLADRLNGGC
jgi:hypothetical protein